MIRTTSRLRSINPVQLGLVLGLIYAVLSFFIAILLLIFSSMAPFAMGSYFMFGHSALTLIVFPVCYFIAGFIGGLISAAIYNLVAGWIGGVEITLDTTPG